MSADSKRKRGIAGKANAESSPYRMNGGGCYPMYMRRILGNLAYSIGRKPGTSAGVRFVPDEAET